MKTPYWLCHSLSSKRITSRWKTIKIKQFTFIGFLLEYLTHLLQIEKLKKDSNNNSNSLIIVNLFSKNYILFLPPIPPVFYHYPLLFFGCFFPPTPIIYLFIYLFIYFRITLRYESVLLRAKFDKNKDEVDMVKAKKLVNDANYLLWKYQHPQPFKCKAVTFFLFVKWCVFRKQSFIKDNELKNFFFSIFELILFMKRTHLNLTNIV